MRAWLHALALLAVVLAFGVSFAFLSTLPGITWSWLALVLMFYFLGVAKVAEPLLRLRMPRGLYELRYWEQDGDLLRKLHILRFGRLLRRTPLRYLNADVYLGHRRRDPLEVRLRAESAEAIHFWAAVLFTPCIVLAAATGKWSTLAWFLWAQLLVNVYPILHLRHTRWRLNRARRTRVTRADRKSAT
jgi:Glycosyl-4,4'-diaponeurosporenoate acyltransferase